MATLNLSYEAAKELYQMAESRVQSGVGKVTMWREIADGLREQCQLIHEWTPNRNCIRLAGDGWMVSYKEHPSDSDTPETALIDRRNNAFFMLSGDHRQAYEDVADLGWDALYAKYLSLVDQYPHEA